MVRVQLVIPNEDRDRFVHQARREGMTLSAWLRAAARDRLGKRQRTKPFESAADLEAFSVGAILWNAQSRNRIGRSIWQ